MKLVVLGSGTSVPHGHRSSPAFWLETSSGNALLDIGPDAPHRMAEEQLDWPNLDAIWISHFHLDHFGGLAPFLFSLKWAPQTQQRTKPLHIFGPPGLRNLLNAINDANNYRLFSQRFELHMNEVAATAEFQLLPSLRATTLKTPHSDESLALRLTDKAGRSLVYTADTGLLEDLRFFARHVDLLLIECSFRRNKPLQSHLELAEVLNLAKSSSPKRLLLTHLYPEWDGVDVIAEARQFWSGECIEAIDGLVVTF